MGITFNASIKGINVSFPEEISTTKFEFIYKIPKSQQASKIPYLATTLTKLYLFAAV